MLQKNRFESVFRPNARPLISAPLCVRSVGRCVLRQPCLVDSEDRPAIRFSDTMREVIGDQPRLLQRQQPHIFIQPADPVGKESTPATRRKAKRRRR